MVEINPLVVTDRGRLLALDAKMSFDDNALFRRPNISELRDKSQEDPRETRAADRGLSYVGLDGKIGCIINGAGLAMATMDMIKHAGGEPANFLDIGGGATPERVAKAFNLVLSDEKRRGRSWSTSSPASTAATGSPKGIVQALEKIDMTVPLVVRLAGTNVEEGRKILDPRAACRSCARTPWPRPPSGRRGLAQDSTTKLAGGSLMSILLDRRDTGHRSGLHRTDRLSFHAEEMMDYGTNVVGRRDPGQGRHDARPAGLQLGQGSGQETGATASVVFVPPPFAADSIMEAADAGIGSASPSPTASRPRT